MILYLSKKILLNTGFKIVESENKNDIVFIYEFTNNKGDLDLKEAKYKFNKVFELFKHDIKEIYDLTGLKHTFKIKGEYFIINTTYE